MSGLYDYVGLALDAVVTAYLIKLHRRDCKTINNIKNAPSVDIGCDLTNLLESCPNLTLPYATVRGRVTPIKDTVESSTGEQGVVKIITLHDVTSRSFGDLWDYESLPPTHETRNVVPFALKSLKGSEGNFTVKVENPFESIWESLLLPTSSSFTPKNTSISSTVMGGIGSAKVLGVRKTEKFLPLGVVVTGIGEVVKDPHSGLIMLREPAGGDPLHPYILTTLTNEELISKLEFRKNVQRLIIGMAAMVGLVLLGRRMFGWWRNYRMKLLRDSIIRERRNMNLDDLCRCQTCLVCLQNPREVILLDCGHVCVCCDCALKVNGLCPVCRERISSTKKAYIA